MPDVSALDLNSEIEKLYKSADFQTVIDIVNVNIKRLEDSKHIFSHKEWHMTGYAIRVDELEGSGGKSSLLFVEREEAQERYAIPAAYAAYTKYLNIKLGSEKFQ